MNFKETKQTKPCMGCPFKKDNNLSNRNPGGSPPEVYLGQARGPFWLPCHQDKNYNNKESDPREVSQCRGAAIFRSNCGEKYKRPKELLKLPEDKETVFADEAEFYANYTEWEENSMRKEFKDGRILDTLMEIELKKSGVKRYS